MRLTRSCQACAAAFSRLRARPLTERCAPVPARVEVVSVSPVSFGSLRSRTLHIQARRSYYGSDDGLGRAGIAPCSSRRSRSTLRTEMPPDVAFVFESAIALLHFHSIDGVLYQGKRGIPGVRELLTAIHAHGVRYLFLTNGGGVHENVKAASLARRLGIPADEEDLVKNRVILSHTPMQGWGRMEKEQTILITGAHPEVARSVAIDYGFRRVITPSDLIHANEQIYPFDKLINGTHAQYRELPDGNSLTDGVSADTLKIDQIFVWNDPRDWSLDIQIIHDLLVSHRGYMGTVSTKNGDKTLPNDGWQQDGQPELWISNLDLFWKTEYPLNRFGTGSFVAALEGVWSAVTGGKDLRYNALGKPSRETFGYAQRRLLHDTPGSAASAAEEDAPARREKQRLRRVYMIGDNPASDVRGANEFDGEDGVEWLSILVETGVWRPSAHEQEPRSRPTVICKDVMEAVSWALRNEGVTASREWLLSEEARKQRK